MIGTPERLAGQVPVAARRARAGHQVVGAAASKPGRLYTPRPAGLQAPRDAVAWRSHARLLVDELAGRRDLRATLRAVVDELATKWHPRTETSGPGHDQLAAAVAGATGRGRCDQATVTRAIARLVEWSLIWEAAPGTIVVGRDGLENLRAEYGLALPRREPSTTEAPDDAPPGGGAGQRTRPDQGWSLAAVTSTKADRIAAAGRLQVEAVSLRGCSAPALASVLREWFVAGWTGRDVLTALDSKPEAGGGWTFTTAPKFVAAWVKYRLRFWRDEAGRPGSSPSQRRASARAAEQARHAQLVEPVEAALTDDAKSAALARCRAAIAARGRATRAAAAQDEAHGAQLAASGMTGSGGLVGVQNADPSSSYLSVGESLTRTRELATTGTPDGVRTGCQLVKKALAAARSATTKPARQDEPTLLQLHSRGVPQLWGGGTV